MVRKGGHPSSVVRVRILGVKVLPHLPSQGWSQAWGLGDRLGAGQLNGVDRAEMGEQIPHPFRTQAGDIAEPGALHALAPLLPMEADGEAVRLIAQAAQQGHTELVRFAVQGLPGTGHEHLFALLGERTHHQIFMQIELPQGFHHGRKLPLAAVDHHHIRPVVEATGVQGGTGEAAQVGQISPLGLGLGPAAKTAAHDLGHGHEVVGVAGDDAAAADLVLAVVLLGGQAIDEHHLGGHRVTALNVADVKAFNAPRWGHQIQ